MYLIFKSIKFISIQKDLVNSLKSISHKVKLNIFLPGPSILQGQKSALQYYNIKSNQIIIN